jgi:SulP family sulfate permease
MKPRVVILGRYKEGTLRDMKIHQDLPTSKIIVAVRFDGSLYFANVSYFEDAIIDAVSQKPNAKYVLVVGDGINQLDASGEEVLHNLNDRLRENGIILVFSGLKRQILEVLRHTGLMASIGEENFHATEDMALEYIYKQLGDDPELDLNYRLLKPAQAQ